MRNGLGRGRGAFANPETRRRLARLEGLPSRDRLVLELALRPNDQLQAELLNLEREIIRRGRNLPGLTRLLQIHGLSLISAIGILAEIGDVRHFASAKQLVSYAGLATAARQSGATITMGTSPNNVAR